MPRYIDADALIDRIKRDVITLSKDAAECKEFMIEHIAMDWFAPTTNVAPIADTVKKMQERLKAETIIIQDHTGKLGSVVLVGTIDQIAKEILEGTQND
jgi:hypothetical protein